MTNLISGLLPVVLVLAFLGNYAVKINSTPLWIIIVSVLALLVFDFVQSVRSENDNPRR